MHPRSIYEIPGALLKVSRFIVLQGIHLGEHIEHVKAETVHPFLQPEIQDPDDLLPHSRVLPVQIRLLLAEKMEIEVLAVTDPFPGAPCKGGDPVGRGQKFLSFIFTLADDVVIPVWRIRFRDSFSEPGVFCGGMVDHHIHDDLEVPLMAFFKKTVKIFHRTEFLIDIKIIADIIAVIVIRRLVQR